MNSPSNLLRAGFLTLLLSVTATAATVTVDLDSLPTGALSAGDLAAWGITSITSSSGSVPARIFDANDCPSCGYVTPSGTHKFMLSAAGSYPAPTGIFSTTFLFQDPTSFFSFEKLGYSVGSVGVAGWLASGYDASDNLVDSVGVNLAGGLDYPPSPIPVSYTLSGSNAIVKVILLANYNYQSTIGGLAFGNIQFETPAGVPEPGTAELAFGALALLTLGWGKSRR